MLFITFCVSVISFLRIDWYQYSKIYSTLDVQQKWLWTKWKFSGEFWAQIFGDNQVGGENNFRFLLFSGCKLNPFNVITLQYLIAVEEPEIFVLRNIFGLWAEKHNLTLLRQGNCKSTFERSLVWPWIQVCSLKTICKSTHVHFANLLIMKSAFFASLNCLQTWIIYPLIPDTVNFKLYLKHCVERIISSLLRNIFLTKIFIETPVQSLNDFWRSE